MATPLSFELISKVSMLRHLLSRTASPHLCNGTGRAVLARSFASRIQFTYGAVALSGSCNLQESSQSVFKSNKFVRTPLSLVLQPVLQCCWVPTRNYGHKMRQNPPKITNFEYSGDLRTLPVLDKHQPLYKYRGLETETEGNEVLKKLTSLEFASPTECTEHRKQLIKDRILALFGPDCALELHIALLTLNIRTMLPYCLKNRHDKMKKTLLVKRIHHRKKLLNGLRKLDHERFEWLLKELKIRYVIPKDKEVYLGWKHNLRVAKHEEVKNNQKKKLEELKAKFDAEKKDFFERKANILAAIEEDLKKFGLSRDFLDQVLEENKTPAQQHDQNTTSKT